VASPMISCFRDVQDNKTPRDLKIDSARLDLENGTDFPALFGGLAWNKVKEKAAHT
jgi:hypothetical protein